MSRRSSRPNRPRPPAGGSHTARQNQHDRGSAFLAELSESELYELAENKPDVLFLILDGVQDPHNLGACLRSADGAGVDAIIIPKNKAAKITDTVRRIACGAASHVPVVPVGNLARCMTKLRDDHQVRIVGTSDQATVDLYDTALTGALAITLGAEENGMRRLTSEQCDQLIRIPMAGKVECLNVSNATAVCLFEAVRQRRASE
ncbi:MAG: 23S rRNA (guanosine(2251)-2'-O)-methyltransferase RlmB [Verrucomicrobiota bacterium]